MNKTKTTEKKKGEIKAINTIAKSAVQPLPESSAPRKMTIRSSNLKYDVTVPTKIIAVDPKYVPQYKTNGAACADVVARITGSESGAYLDKEEPGKDPAWALTIPSRCLRTIDCGFRIQLPEGWKAEISARSGHASKGLIVCNAPGQIDEDYRGPVKVILGNIGNDIQKIRDGDRIAQIFPAPVYKFEWENVQELDVSDRGEGGFGSTGVSSPVSPEIVERIYKPGEKVLPSSWNNCPQGHGPVDSGNAYVCRICGWDRNV